MLARTCCAPHTGLELSNPKERRVLINIELELDPTSAATVVPRRDERHRGQDCIAQLVPNIHLDSGALLVPPALDIRHRDVLSQRRRGNAGRDGAWRDK